MIQTRRWRARHRRTRQIAWPTAVALVASTLVAIAVTTSRQPVAAATLPEGDIVPSVTGVGKTAGSFTVTGDGAARYTVPMWVPQGRGTAEPELSLAYDSRGGNGLAGVGWSLGGLSSIAPCARTIAQDGHTDGVHFDGTDVFCLGGVRLLPISAAQLPEREYRTEQESFARVMAYGMEDNVPSHFRIWTKDRKILSFGQTADSRRQAFRLTAGTDDNTLVRESTTRVAVAWDLNRIEDRNGNAATVEYERVEGSAAQLWHVESRPLAIRYAPNREVRFGYQDQGQDQDRPDPIESYGRGVHLREPKRLTTVSMFAGPQGGDAELLRQYRLGYQNTSVTKRSLLASVTECDGGGAGAACKVPVTFNWSMGGYALRPINTGVTDAGQPLPLNGQEPPEGNEIDNQIVVADFNGDARDDILYPNTDDWLREGQQQRWYVRLSTGSGFGPAREAGFAPPVKDCYNPNPPDGRIECTASEGNVRPIDVDLDGRTEVMVWVPVTAARSRWRLYTFNGTTFVPHSAGLETADDTGNDPDPVFFADLDGNNTPDLITAPMDHPASAPCCPRINGPWSYRLNTGRSGAARFAAPVNTGQLVPVVPTAKVTDVDGDGRADVTGSATHRSGVGWGLGADGEVEPRRYAGNPTAADSQRAPVPADVNGDGLEDAVSAYTLWRGPSFPPPGRLVAALNSANGVAPYSQAPNDYFEPRYCCGDEPPPPGGEPRFVDYDYDRGVRYVDVNGDGADDVLVFRGNSPVAGQPVGLQGTQLYIWRAGAFERAPLNAASGDWGPHGFRASKVLDIDGNTVPDLLIVSGDQLRVLRRTDAVPDRLIGIGDPDVRDRIEVDYTTLADSDVHTPDTCNWPLMCLSKGGSVVAQHRTWTFATSGTSAGWDRYDHLYTGARLDPLGRGSLGMASHTVTRSATGAATTTWFDNDIRNDAIGAYPFAGIPKEVTTTVEAAPGGRVSQTSTVTIPTVRRHPGGGYSVEPLISNTTQRERAAGAATWTTLRHTGTTTVSDDFGNPKKVTTVTANGRTLVDETTYRNDTANWLLGLPVRISAKSCAVGGSPCVTRLSTADYDDKGNHTDSINEPNRPKFKLTSKTIYDPFGNVTSVTRTDSAGHIRRDRFEYDADRLHPTATINALEHRTAIDTHSGLGVPRRTTDPNGVASTFFHDRFGRIRATYHADGGFETVEHAVSEAGHEVTTTSVAGGGQTIVRTDQLGRVRERGTKTFAGAIASAFTHYDALGRARQVSRPRVDGESLHYTTTEHDNLDRPVSVTAPDGVRVRHTYLNRESHTYDGRGVHTYTVTNADGEVESSFEPNPASDAWLHTRFEYGPFGQAAKTVAPDDSAQVMRYDVLGNRIRLEDPSAGVTVTEYDAFGDATTETAAGGRTTTRVYDALGRLTTATSPDGTATNVWDTAARGKGLIARATSTDGVVTSHTYDEHAKPESTTWTVEGTGYRIDHDYDVLGRPSGMTYPAIPGNNNGRLTVAYGYNPSGYLLKVTNGAGGQAYWTAEERDSAGQLTRERLGSGGTSVAGGRTYNTVGLLTGVTVSGTVGGRMSDLEYVYDENRNVVKRQDNERARYDRYGYDPLNRIRTWRLTADDEDHLTTYTYDEMGNLKAERVDSRPERDVTYAHGGQDEPRHALTTRNGASYEYDQAGRQLSGAGRTVTYNQADLPRSITWGQGQRSDFRYDATGARVLKRDGANSVITVGGLFERRNPETGGTHVDNLHNIVVEGRVVAQISRVQATPTGAAGDPVARYVHSDLQGSTVLVTNAAGRPMDTEESWLREIFYDPFGRRVQADGTPLGNQRRGGPRQGYTGHEHDDEFGLINMKGRVYDPEQRRFLTADPVVEDPLSSQAFNRYAYVRNNPATRTDPTGHTSLAFDMQMNGSYSGLEGTNVSLSYSDLSDGRRMGQAIGERLNASDQLWRAGDGAPATLNAPAADAARSDGDSGARDRSGSCHCADDGARPATPSDAMGPSEVTDHVEAMAERQKARTAERRAAAKESFLQFFKSRVLFGRSEDELRVFIGRLEARGCWQEGSIGGEQLEAAKVALYSLAGKQDSKQSVIDKEGRSDWGLGSHVYTKKEMRQIQRAAAIKAELSVLTAPPGNETGNLMSGFVFTVTGDAGRAAFAGAMFDLKGTAAGLLKGDDYQLKPPDGKYQPLQPDPLKDY
jgi:RHS repeat-associated protein